MDIVIPLRSGQNEELRYALRSWDAHLSFSKVWVIGGKPAWLANVNHIRTSQAGSKYKNTTTALKKACETDGVSEQFIYLNDDMFLMREFDNVPVYHRGLMSEFAKNRRLAGPYLRGAKNTLKLLTELGHHQPLSYEVHVPMVLDKTLMLKALEIGKHVNPLHKRSLYGNLVGLGGQRIQDPKVATKSAFDRRRPIISTSDDSFKRGQVGVFIRQRFPEPSRFER
ncbi:hypothetical protein [Phytoactinopolyspora mesophila]|uniref:Uncharacterized protein n=1 Tax=Phytoactinopolyspora mesophila TaxID=2650750 RepID=A0A7K3M5N9_9ACTN|nr:hypothetical protein [Phytoactinopolyspora mesophila]NDL58639.1 hypothetical protein [Phytoactinopolyspora mesophila]